MNFTRDASAVTTLGALLMAQSLRDMGGQVHIPDRILFEVFY
jgi:hypothetical protein